MDKFSAVRGISGSIALWCALGFQGAHATCPNGVPQCAPNKYYVTHSTLPELLIQASATADATGNWNYAYKVVRAPNDNSPTPYDLATLSLPYYGDAGISNLRIEETGPSTYATYRPPTVAITDGANSAGAQTIFLTQATPRSVYTMNLTPDVSVTVQFTSPFAPSATGTANLTFGWTTYLTSNSMFGTDVTFRSGVSPAPTLSLATILPGSPQALAASVPEPETWATMSLGLLGLMAAAWRQRSAPTA